MMGQLLAPEPICGIFYHLQSGAVVTKDVPDYALIVGAPAKQADWVCECRQRLGEALKCTVYGRGYLLDGGRLVEGCVAAG